MSSRELREHSDYLDDIIKVEAYRAALRVAIDRSGPRVLDLGSGTGLLGLLAQQEGASFVTGVDSGSIIGPSSDTASRNGFNQASVTFLRGFSTEIELDELVDVAVCDQIGGFAYDAGVLEYFADARRRLLKPGGALVPTGFRLFVAPASCATIRDQIDLWGSRPAGIDFAVFRELAVNTEHRISSEQCELLAAGVEVARIASDHDEPITGSGTVTFEGAGRCDGVVGWFEADLGGGVTLTNHPADPGRMNRWCNFYPIENPVDVDCGDTVEIGVDVRPLLYAMTWRVEIRGPQGRPKSSERHSTLLGKFISKEDLARSSGTPVVSGAIGHAVARALDLADGTRSTNQIIDALRSDSELPEMSVSNEQTVRDLLQRLTEPV